MLIGSVTDPYNPLEKKYSATQGVLERLIEMKSGANFEILTKSPLVLRDLDLLKKLENITVGISLSTCDKAFAKLIKPHAASPEQRINVIHELKNVRIPVYTFISLIFPYLSDWREVVDFVREYADKICFENLNLRGEYRTLVMDMVQNQFAEVYPKFAEIYSNKTRNREFCEMEAEEIRKYMSGKTISSTFSTAK